MSSEYSISFPVFPEYFTGIWHSLANTSTMRSYFCWKWSDNSEITILRDSIVPYHNSYLCITFYRDVPSERHITSKSVTHVESLQQQWNTGGIPEGIHESFVIIGNGDTSSGMYGFFASTEKGTEGGRTNTRTSKDFFDFDAYKIQQKTGFTAQRQFLRNQYEFEQGNISRLNFCPNLPHGQMMVAS